MEKTVKKNTDQKGQLSEIKTLRQRIRELEKVKRRCDVVEQKLNKQAHDLGERIKELNYLYSLSGIGSRPDLSVEEMFDKAVARIPPAWQYPKITCGKIVFNGREYKSANCGKAASSQSADIIVEGEKAGVVEVSYTKKMPDMEEGPFLKEERDLIDAIGKSLGSIIERKIAENRIKRASEEWERTFDAISDLVFIQDKDFTIIKANKAFAEAIGMKPKDIVGKKCYEIIHKTKSPWPSCPFEQTRLDKKAHSEEVDDPVFNCPLLVTTSPIFGDKGEFLGSVHVAKDITARKKIEQMKDEFVSMVSHELRTPLAIIRESFYYIKNKVVNDVDEKQKVFFDVADRSVNRLERLIDDILDYQKLSAGKMDFEMKSWDINDIVTEVVDEMKSLMKGKEVELVARPAKPLEKAKFDKNRIVQVLTNLISNAIKFTDKGSITLVTAKRQDKICVSVVDTGIGIKKGDMEKLFQTFTRIPGGKAGQTKGTGLGLVISKKIVEQHGGRIWAESEYGRGSVFTFCLPAIKKKKRTSSRKI